MRANRETAFSAALVFGVALGARLFHLGGQSLWMDESFSVWMASHGVSGILTTLQTDAHPPFFYLFLHFWMKWFSPPHRFMSEALLRLPFAVMGCVSAVLVFAIAKRCFSEKAGLLAGLAWGVSFKAIMYETQVRMYPMAVLFSLASTLFFLWAFDKGGWRWGFYVASAALCFYTHYFTGFIVGTQLVYLYLSGRRRQAGVLALILSVLCLPGAPLLAHQFLLSGGRGMHPPGERELFMFSEFLGVYYLAVTGGWHPLWVNAAAQAIGLAGVIWGIVWLKGFSKPASVIGWLFAVPLFVPLLTSEITSHHIFISRYMVLFAPYFFMLFILGATRVKKEIGQTVLAGFLLVNAAMWSFSFTPRFQRQNWRVATRFMAPKLRAGDSVFVEYFMSFFPLWYYLPDEFEPKYLPGKYLFEIIPTNKNAIVWYPVDDTYARGYLRGVLNRSKRVWLVLCVSKTVDPGDKIKGFFDASAHESIHRTYYSMDPDNQIRILLYEKGVSRP